MSKIIMLLEKIKNVFVKTREEKILDSCGCICRCPECDEPLNDQAEYTDTDLVRYTCKCGCKSEWDFDIAPVPILVKQK